MNLALIESQARHIQKQLDIKDKKLANKIKLINKLEGNK